MSAKVIRFPLERRKKKAPAPPRVDLTLPELLVPIAGVALLVIMFKLSRDLGQ